MFVNNYYGVSVGLSLHCFMTITVCEIYGNYFSSCSVISCRFSFKLDLFLYVSLCFIHTCNFTNNFVILKHIHIKCINK